MSHGFLLFIIMYLQYLIPEQTFEAGQKHLATPKQCTKRKISSLYQRAIKVGKC